MEREKNLTKDWYLKYKELKNLNIKKNVLKWAVNLNIKLSKEEMQVANNTLKTVHLWLARRCSWNHLKFPSHTNHNNDHWEQK